MKSKDIVKKLNILFWLFVIGSIIGYIFEMLLVLLKKGFFETRQGLIYGPFIPVYGIGAIIYYLVLNNIDSRNKIQIFIICAILGGVTEYICSFMQEKMFGTISWDYSNLPFNINGRTSLLHCSYWGMAGIFYIQFIEPLLPKIQEGININSVRKVTIIFAILMSLDIGISCIAAERQKERRYNIKPKNQMDLFLDQYYPDEFMDSVYTNKKEVTVSD